MKNLVIPLILVVMVSAYSAVAASPSKPSGNQVVENFSHKKVAATKSRVWPVIDDTVYIDADLSGDGHRDELIVSVVYTAGMTRPSLVRSGFGYTLFWPFEKLGEIRVGDIDKDGDADIIIDEENVLIMGYNDVAAPEKNFEKVLKEIDRRISAGDILGAFMEAFEVGLGTPHDWGVAGEGKEGEFDRDLEVYLDRGNCVTWTEQVLAMIGSGGTYDGFFDQLMEIRYKDGIKEYGERNHFQEVDWIPNNIEAGFITDIMTYLLGGIPTVTATNNKKNWYELKNSLDGDFSDLTEEEYEERLDKLRQLGANMEEETVSLGYYPFDKMYVSFEGGYKINPDFIERLPPIVIFNIVNEGLSINDADGSWVTDLVVNHVGFIVKDEPGHLMAVHSTPMTDAALSIMAEEDFLSFLQRRFIGNKETKAVGLHLSEPKIPKSKS